MFRLTRPHSRSWSRILAALASISFFACAEEAPPWRAPNIVLISVDTLRADRMSTYGYARPTTPRIDRLAAQSAVFERAYTHAPHTLAAHVSLMTSLYPGRHGVLFRGNSLDPNEVTLAEMLEQQGYRCLAFVNALFLSPEFRIDRGFDVYDYAHDIKDARNAEQTNATIRDHLSEPQDAPLFLFVHYFDPHSDSELPYEAPPEYLERFAGPIAPSARLGQGDLSASKRMLQWNQRRKRLRPDQLEFFGHLYDAGVAYTDEQVGSLLDSLDELGLLENSIVILISDHGEEFQDHGELLHGQVYEELVRVPVLVSLPEMRGSTTRSCRNDDGLKPTALPPRRVTGLIQLADLLPTIAECLGVDPPPRAQGHSFLGMLAGGESARRTAYFESAHHGQRGILRDDWKLIEADGRRPQLYDLARDPGERNNLAEKHPKRVAELSSELARYREANLRSRSRGDDFEIAPELERALEALGYATTTGPQ